LGTGLVSFAMKKFKGDNGKPSVAVENLTIQESPENKKTGCLFIPTNVWLSVLP
jgi:hypothetical protein